MPATVLVGAQWGDEGKGRVADKLAAESDVVARYAGGDNAGHTVRVGDTTFKLHLIPSGILNPRAVCVLGAGTVINPLTLISEIDYLAQGGIEVTPDRLAIDPRAHIITPIHIALDGAGERALGKNAIGTTNRGIGPAYASKATRTGIRVGGMGDPEQFGDQVEQAIAEGNRTLSALYGQPPIEDAVGKTAGYVDAARRLAPYVRDCAALVQDALEEAKQVLCEGAQGTLLDLDHGQYPFVTSSSPTVGGAIIGLGFGPQYITRVIGAAKAFSTRVGGGPFPTELIGALGDRLRGTGENPWDEYGTTTGRPRRCGWLDVVLMRYAARLNGFTELILNKLDVLSGLPELAIAVAYQIDGKRITTMPYDWQTLNRAEPVYETLPGWSESITNAKTLAELPVNARTYLERIETLIGVPVTAVGVGPEREQLISR
ncbi:MAG: adenylosuccinate synthase [Aggregatilineales bacterium]